MRSSGYCGSYAVSLFCLHGRGRFRVSGCFGGAAAPDLPTFAATKVDGTDNVHIFRYLRHQSMFVATPKGLIAIA
jgi:hypothetical protein